MKRRTDAPTLGSEVQFRVYKGTPPGKRFVVAGNASAPGAWSLAVSNAQPNTNEGSSSWWQGHCAFPPGAAVEYVNLKENTMIRGEEEIQNQNTLTKPGTMLLDACSDCEKFGADGPSNLDDTVAQIAPSCHSTPRDSKHMTCAESDTSQEKLAPATLYMSSPPLSDDSALLEDSHCPEIEFEPVPSLPKKEVSISSMMTKVPAVDRELSGLSSIGDFEPQPQASEAPNAAKEMPCDRRRRVAMASLISGAAVLSTGGGAAGLVTGGVVGVVVGVLPGMFTFGLSIPLFAAIGGGCGLATGAVVGGAIGVVGGVAVGRRFCGKRKVVADTRGKYEYSV
mmetsp:Transcript_75010/g.195085  ORF Transcript_75010/g.195085 Transcript_75010/m.195085 type:complete len:338 (+) Transcript_75010:118-1131(+)